MNINQFDKTKFGIEGPGVDTVTTADRNWKDKTTGEVSYTIPAGSKVHVDFSPKTHPSNIFITFNGEVKISRAVSANKWLKKFSKVPSIKTLQKWEWDQSMCKTITGHKTEPDGFGPDGSPSWMLVVGII